MNTVVVTAPVATTVEVASPAVTVEVANQAVTVQVLDEGAVVVENTPAPPTVVAVSNEHTVTAEVVSATVTTVGTPGPAGADAEDLGMKYRLQTDIEEDTPSAGQTTIYKGWAAAGAGGSDAAVWRVQRMVLNSEDDVTDSGFADGNLNYDNIWDDRAALSYS